MLKKSKGRSVGEACTPDLDQPRLRRSLRSQDTARARDAYSNDHLPGVSPGFQTAAKAAAAGSRGRQPMDHPLPAVVVFERFCRERQLAEV